MNIKRALLSVYDKTGIVEFARALDARDVQILSSGSTYDLLFEKGIRVTSLEEYAEVPESLGESQKIIGKSLAAAVVEKGEDSQLMKIGSGTGIQRIDLIAVNLNPFEETAKSSRNEFDLIKSVDIGRCNLIRAAAKNYRDVVVLTDPYDYSEVIDSLDFCGDVPLQRRRLFSLKGFYRTMHYDASVHGILSLLFAKEKFDHFIMERIFDFNHGENYQQDAFFAKCVDDNSENDEIRLVSGKKLSFREYEEIHKGVMLLAKIENDAVVFIENGHITAFEALPEGKKSLYNLNSRITHSKNTKGILIIKGEIDLDKFNAIDESKVSAICFESELSEEYFKMSLFPSASKVAVNLDELTDFEYRYLNNAFLVQERDSKKLYGKYRHGAGKIPDETERKDIDISMKIAGSSVSLAVAVVHSGELIAISQGNSDFKVAIDNVFGQIPNSKGVVSESVIALDNDPDDMMVIRQIINLGFKKIVIPGRKKFESEFLNSLSDSGIDIYFSGREHFSI